MKVVTFLERVPCAALLPFVSRLWVADELPTRAGRELVLPSASMRIVFRLTQPLRTFDSVHDIEGRVVGHANIGGPRMRAYLRDISLPVLSVGAELRPGVGVLLLGVPADALASRHTALADVWGREAERIRERLLEAGEAARQLAILESALLLRSKRVASGAPALLHALAGVSAGHDVSEVAARSGYSHKHLVELFRRSVGITPKLYGRVLRFQRALELAADGNVSWAQLALDTGYSDQAHFSRDFHAFTGMTPGQYPRVGARFVNHVPLAVGSASREVKFLQDRGHEREASLVGTTEKAR